PCAWGSFFFCFIVGSPFACVCDTRAGRHAREKEASLPPFFKQGWLGYGSGVAASASAFTPGLCLVVTLRIARSAHQTCNLITDQAGF
ncbi:hypothetical protein BX661DRAFT_184144, partial [Kickxella alabastrina]|uniref:uncharacterized protein n=1 Tax=Kickxella alabastrina TaxID=61397 RepID=UPI00221EFA1E